MIFEVLALSLAYRPKGEFYISSLLASVSTEIRGSFTDIWLNWQASDVHVLVGSVLTIHSSCNFVLLFL